MWETYGQDDASHLKSQAEFRAGDSCEGLIVEPKYESNIAAVTFQMTTAAARANPCALPRRGYGRRHRREKIAAALGGTRIPVRSSGGQRTGGAGGKAQRTGNKAHCAKIGTKMRDGSARIEEGAGGESTRKRMGKGEAHGAPSI